MSFPNDVSGCSDGGGGDCDCDGGSEVIGCCRVVGDASHYRQSRDALC